MATLAAKFQGSKLEAMDGTEATQVAELLSIDGPGGQGTIIDATHADSTAREKIMGLPDEGRVTLSCNYVNEAGQNLLRSRRNAQTLDSYRISIPDSQSTTATFTAYCMSAPISGSIDGKWDARYELEISGSVTFTP